MTEQNIFSTSHPIGAHLLPEGHCIFRVWAPDASTVELVTCDTACTSAMTASENGYWQTEARDIKHGCRYRYRIDGEKERPDPASHWQPDGVHGPSAVVDHNSFVWHDAAWQGLSREQAIIYELHTGAFSPEGTFDGIIKHLAHLCTLGITAIEIMPVAQFPGVRNWGYDGVHPFAVQTSYGGVDGLKRLIDACHQAGIAVILDVVYNHLGPEGNYVWEYGPYFTRNKYRTPWGWAVNFDDAGSDEVRAYFIANALYWLDTFHIDGLRLDAVHSIFDMSARTFLKELAEAVGSYGRSSGIQRMVIAESDLNDPRIIRPTARGGMGLDAQWSDDLHHAMHTALTGERSGYYQDFTSGAQIAKALRTGYAYSGEYSAYRQRRHGAVPHGVPANAFIVCSQNHDQIGNRMLGDRLISLAGADGARLAAAVVLLSPMVPMLFMGEEWGETNPFQYFVDHGDPALCEAVRIGRTKEFAAFHHGETVPDPTAPETYRASSLNWAKPETQTGSQLLAYYHHLIELRKCHPVLSVPTFDRVSTALDPGDSSVVRMIRERNAIVVFIAMNFGTASAEVLFPHSGTWRLLIASSDGRWGGSGPDAPETMTKASATVLARNFLAYELVTVADTEMRFA
jgi:maltooligosyltrehalose trehalohydrolase